MRGFRFKFNDSSGLASVLSLAVTLSIPAGAALADRATDSRLLASQCAQCHGTNGVSAGGFDSLAGESIREIEEELSEVLTPGESSDIMDHQAQGYNDYQIRLIAEYFSRLPKAPKESGEDDEVDEVDDVDDDETS